MNHHGDDRSHAVVKNNNELLLAVYCILLYCILGEYEYIVPMTAKQRNKFWDGMVQYSSEMIIPTV